MSVTSDDIDGECSVCHKDLGEGIVGLCSSCFSKKYKDKELSP